MTLSKLFCDSLKMCNTIGITFSETGEQNKKFGRMVGAPEALAILGSPGYYPL